MNQIQMLSSYQNKINEIVFEVPLLIERLEVVLNKHVILTNINHGNPPLYRLQQVVGRMYNFHNPVIERRQISAATVAYKKNELEQLEREIVTLFRRVEMLIPPMTIQDLMEGHGRLFVGPYRRIKLYRDYVRQHRLEMWGDDDSGSE